MSSDSLSIVPVHLKTNPSSKSERTSLKPICIIQVNHVKVHFYPDVKPFIITNVNARIKLTVFA